MLLTESIIKDFTENQLAILKNAKTGTKIKIKVDNLGYLLQKYKNINCKCL